MAWMYIDIPENQDGVEPTIATFRETGASQVVRALELEREGVSSWCLVVGWDHGLTTAHITPIEESGDGPARLIHGGAGGVRLQVLQGEPLEDADLTWNPQGRTWAEPFLILTPQARWR